MKIGIDGNEANIEKRVGIGEYAYELLLRFYDLHFSMPSISFEIYLKFYPISDMPGETDRFKYKVIGPKKMWTQIALPLSLFLSSRPDVFFSPSHYAPRFSPVPTAISIMDLSYIRFPSLFTKHDLFQLTNWTGYSVRKAKKIFTISNSSRNDIIKTYRVPGENVIVTYPGIKQTNEDRIDIRDMINLNKKFGIRGNYILFVGTLQPRKNIAKLIEAFSQLSRKNLELVIVGKKGWLYEDILKAPKKYNVEQRVRFLDFIEDKDLPALYGNATCFVLPSLYEGFGLPVLEAMKYGCPVITSNVSSLPEAGGDAALYFDPENTEDIVNKMEEVLGSEALRAEMIKQGYLQVKKFSWDKTAKKTLDILQEMANKN